MKKIFLTALVALFSLSVAVAQESFDDKAAADAAKINGLVDGALTDEQVSEITAHYANYYQMLSEDASKRKPLGRALRIAVSKVLTEEQAAVVYAPKKKAE
ncbi:MAG: hypothetical protein R3Y38_01255 [Rikenellaceae bacterium]